MGETITIRTGAATEVIKVVEQGPQGPQGPAGTGLTTLTQSGDMLYRDGTGGQRLPIGTAGQILKVNSGGTAPEWGAAPASGVSSVNGQTGVVTVAALNHTHEAADLFFQGLEILDAGNANTNGVYVYGGVFGGKGIYYKDKDSFIYWDGAAWMVSYNSDDIYSSAQNTTTPWQVTSWSVEVGQTSPAPSSWDRLTGDQWEAVVGQRINPTLRGTAAGKNVGTGANDVAAGNDSRFTDARQPLSHSSTHHTGETDALAAHQINGQTIFSASSAVYSADQSLPANRARQLTVSNTNASGITLTLPTQAEGTLNGDTYVIVGGNTMSGPITVRGVANLSPLVYNTLVTITATGQQYRLRSGGGSSGNWSLIPVDTHTHTGSEVNVGTTANLPLITGTNGVIEAGSFGTAAGNFCEGNDARLSDARTPSSTLAHKASHATGGTDALAPSDIGAIFQWSVFEEAISASPTTLATGRARRITISTTLSTDTEVLLPTTGNQDADLFQLIRSGNIANGRILVKTSAGGSTLADLGTKDNEGRSFTFRWQTGGSFWAIVPVDAHGADKITSGTLDVARLPVGTGSTQISAGNHTHVVADVTGAAASGSITTSGLTQSTARILGRTSASTGSIEEIQIGSGLSLSAGELSSTAAGGGATTQTNVYTSGDTWNKPAGAKKVHYVIIGGGGGGGAGRRSASGTAAFGGGGGAGGSLVVGWVDPAFLGSSVTVTVGTGGTGGADSADSTNGAGGSSGGSSSFGSTLTAGGGAGGGGGTDTTGGSAAGTGGTDVCLFYSANAARIGGGTGTSSGNVASLSNSLYLPAGGNGGSGVDTGTSRGNGGNGRSIGQTGTGVTNGGQWGGNRDGQTSHINFAGTGGAGAQAAVTTIEGRAGGNGGLYGGGGGGGSGARNGAGGSTAGGNGGAGIVVITTFF